MGEVIYKGMPVFNKQLVVFVLMCFSFTTASTQNEIHVYSTEIPWVLGTISEDPAKTYSINEAIGQASNGDVIVIHEGIYRERVVVNKNNISISNYQDDYVLVTGADVVSGTWEDASGMTSGVKALNISGVNIETDYSQLFSNGRIQKLGRHPNRTIDQTMEVIAANNNGGYAPVKNGSKPEGADATAQITFEETTIPSVDLTGGIIRAMTGKMRNYAYGDIVSNSGNTVSFKAINNNTDWKKEGAIATTRFKMGWGFVLHKNLVDTPGEWFIDDNTLFYYPQVGENLNESRIEIQTRERVLVLNNSSGTNISGINFVAGNVDAQSTNNTTIDGCTFRYVHPFWIPNGYGQGNTDRQGIFFRNSSNNTLKNSYFGHTWANMIAFHFGQNNTVENCTIEDFGTVGVFTSGVHVNQSDNTSISKCTFGDAGRFQIRIDGGDAKVDILDSDFYGAMKMGEDAGPFEATSTGKIGALSLKGSTLAYNKVHDVKGLPVWDGNYSRQKVVAFYMEDTQNYTAHHNLIYNIKADNYNGPVENEQAGEFLYLGPRYNRMDEPVNYYNNTIWNYDKLFTIWGLEIDNWEELGLAEEENKGTMEDGHFANNVFMTNSKNVLSYGRQKLSPTGGNLGWVSLNPSPSLETSNLTEYFTHCSNYGFQFNPQNNIEIDFANQDSDFVSASTGDFNLQNTSSAKNAGVEIPGITNSSNPDSGALEGGNRVLNAGSSIVLPSFLEQVISIQNVRFTIAVTSENCPNKDNGKLRIVPSISADYEVTFNATTYEFTAEISFDNIAPGDYDVCINIKGETENQCFVVKVNEAEEITLKSVLKSKQLDVNIATGTAPYKVMVNDVLVLETMSSAFTINVNHGDSVKIKTDKACEGELIKSIDFYSDIEPYPNPTSGNFKLSLPINEGRIPIEIYDIRGQLITSDIFTINSGEIELNLSGNNAGMYFVKLNLDNPINFKIIKK
ncbi:T9SS type A sorting domain-containing protein [Seonamhaeicola marinus]|uniref:T9SS type A sorting domain-containing protein n=1 Tax=Seonamhaeicola marinus TaxID=1912246 RepID=A0A5D0HTC1_9FLAO|nr:T9SS type A sorting domain-containing protein [Seonamhaeicola marinus]TYA74643.1 T9SS type A sorting domain-containing protein [Seonamhaeicola marinus]